MYAVKHAFYESYKVSVLKPQRKNRIKVKWQVNYTIRKHLSRSTHLTIVANKTQERLQIRMMLLCLYVYDY